MWINSFPHHCDPMLDRKAMYGRKGLFCLWFEGAESIMAGGAKVKAAGVRHWDSWHLGRLRNGEERMMMQLAF